MWTTLKGAFFATKPRSCLRCSFCGRTAMEVDRLVAGAAAYICDACVTECVSVLHDNGGFETARENRAH